MFFYLHPYVIIKNYKVHKILSLNWIWVGFVGLSRFVSQRQRFEDFILDISSLCDRSLQAYRQQMIECTITLLIIACFLVGCVCVFCLTFISKQLTIFYYMNRLFILITQTSIYICKFVYRTLTIVRPFAWNKKTVLQINFYIIEHFSTEE